MGHSLLLSTLLGWCWAKLLWNESRQTHWFLCFSSIRVLWFLSFWRLPQLQSCWHFSLPLDFCCRKPHLLRLQNRGLPSLRNWPKPSMRRCPRWSLPGPAGFADDSRDFATLNLGDTLYCHQNMNFTSTPIPEIQLKYINSEDGILRPFFQTPRLCVHGQHLPIATLVRMFSRFAAIWAPPKWWIRQVCRLLQSDR